MEWIALKDARQLEQIVSESKNEPVLIYKHSTRCNISRSVFDRLERRWDSASAGQVKRYFLDLLAFRDISDQIAEVFGVEHQSPQILVISDGKSALDLSHYDIDFEKIKSAMKQAGKSA